MKNLEIEAKYIHIDPEKIRATLKVLAFELVYPEFDMYRASFLFEDNDMTLRVRREYGGITLTYKYTDLEKGALGTEEIEVTVNDFDSTVKLLAKTTKPKRILYQESKRELWRKGETEVSIDEWPGTGKFLEIESPTEEALQTTTQSLGLDYKDAIFGRSGEVYMALGFDIDEINSIENLTFSHPPVK